MRWNKTRTGDIRVIKKFAIFPIESNGEVRWLEWVTLKQVAFDVNFYGQIHCWHNKEFVDE